jgi:hypothetical protein
MRANNKFIALIGSLTISIIISACNKPEPLSCDSKETQINLLAYLENNNAGSSFVSAKIANTGLVEDLLNCKASIQFTHSIYPEKDLAVNYIFQVGSSNKIKDLTFENKDEARKYESWIAALPNIISFQKSRYGILAVLQMPQVPHTRHHNQMQQLTFNQNAIKFAHGTNYSSITIDKKFVIKDSDIYLISAYFNAEKDLSSDHNYFVSVLPGKNIQVSPPFSYVDGSMQQNADSITFTGINRKPYAESSDIPLFRFQNNQLSYLKSPKPDSYYKAKFAKITPEQILQQIKADGCLNGDQFYSSDICSSKVPSYCFKFHSISVPIKSKTYWLLKGMCQSALDEE